VVEAGLFLEVVAVLEEVAVIEVEAQDLQAAVVIRSQILHACEFMGAMKCRYRLLIHNRSPVRYGQQWFWPSSIAVLWPNQMHLSQVTASLSLYHCLSLAFARMFQITDAEFI